MAINKEERLALELYIYKDIQESALKDIVEILNKKGNKMNPQFEKKYKLAMKNIRSVLRDITVLSLEDQERYGETADALRETMSLIFMVTGGYPDKIEDIKNLIYKYQQNGNTIGK